MYPIETKNIKITSGFGNREYTYNGKKVKDFHTGIDLIGGEKIIAFESGIVERVVNKGEQYKTACLVRIKHDNGFYTLYEHLKSGSIVVKKGDKVLKGQFLGIIGKTGKATGTHLHFQVDKGNSKTAIDPYDYVIKDKSLTSSYKKGNYKCSIAMYVRTGAGTNYTIKQVKDLTPNGKRQTVNTTPTAKALYRKGTIFTALEIIETEKEVWAKTPSGYVCVKGSSGKVYCNIC